MHWSLGLCSKQTAREMRTWISEYALQNILQDALLPTPLYPSFFGGDGQGIDL